MSKPTLKYVIGLLFIVTICQATILPTEDEDPAVGLDLTENQDGEFLADSVEQAVQTEELDDQTGGRGGSSGHGDGHGARRPFYGGLAVTRYLKTSLARNPIYFDVDDQHIFFNRINDVRNTYTYNYDNFGFSCGRGGWGDLSSYDNHYQTVSRLFLTVVRIQYQNNFFRCYNVRNQVVIVIQIIQGYYRPNWIWGTPRYRRTCNRYPQLTPYRNFPWGSVEVGSVN